jgi:hypothetical protein
MKLNTDPNDLWSCRNQFVDYVQQTGWFDCGLVMEFQVELVFHFPTWFSYFWGLRDSTSKIERISSHFQVNYKRLAYLVPTSLMDKFQKHESIQC